MPINIPINTASHVVMLFVLTLQSIPSFSQASRDYGRATRQLGYSSDLICMSEAEIAACHSAGTEYKSLGANNEDRCKVLNAAKNIGPAKRTFNHKQCPCKPSYSGLKCETCADGYHMKFQPNSALAPPSSQTATSMPLGHLLGVTNVTAQQTRPQSRGPFPGGQFRYFTCKPCNCDRFGSKSFVCDKRNGTCFCVDGHTGIKCDKCALGYYNSSLAASPGDNLARSETRYQSSRPCVECGNCFDQWHIAIMDLKDRSVEMIKRTHELSQSLTSSMGVQTYSSNETESSPMNLDADNHDRVDGSNKITRLVLHGQRDSFNELDEKISIIGERVLETKHKSDQLNLFANELDSCINYLNETKAILSSQEAEFKSIMMAVADLKHRLGASAMELDYLTRTISEKFKREQESIQETLPLGAYKLIRGHYERSLNSLRNSSRTKAEYVAKSNKTRSNLEFEIGQLHASRKKMDQIGSEYLAETMTAQHFDLKQNDSLFVESIVYKLWPNSMDTRLGSPLVAASSYLDQIVRWRGLARSLAREANISANEYLSNSDDRQKSLTDIQLSLNDSVNVIGFIEALIGNLDHNMTRIGQNLAAFNNSESCDFLQVIQNNTNTVRTNLDKLDAKWTTAQNELAELIRLNSTSGIADHIHSFTQEINRTLETLSPKLTAFFGKIATELDESQILNNQSGSLMNQVNALHNKVQQIALIKEESLDMIEKTRLLNKSISDDTTKLQEQINATISVVNKITTSDSVAVEQANRVTSHAILHSKVSKLADRLGGLQINTTIKTLDNKNLIQNKIDTLRKSNEANKILLRELRETYQEISTCLSTEKNVIQAPSIEKTFENRNRTVITGTSASGSTPPSLDESELRAQSQNQSSILLRRARILREQVRVTDLLSEYGSITRQLYGSLGKSRSFNEEFKANKEVFAKQSKILTFLQVELDKLNADIRVKLESYSKRME